MTTADPSPDPAAPPGLRETKKARTRAALARAALQLVAEDGLHATTVEAIATRADVSPRTFFNYFDTKDEAVVHLSGERFRGLMAGLLAEPEATPAGATANPVTRMRDAMIGLLTEADEESATDDNLLRAALERDPSLFGTLHSSMNQVGAEFEAALASRYASDRERDLARLGLSLAMGLTQTAMLDARDGRTDQPLPDRVAHYFTLLESALHQPTHQEGPTA